MFVGLYINKIFVDISSMITKIYIFIYNNITVTDRRYTIINYKQFSIGYKNYKSFKVKIVLYILTP